MNAPQDGHSRAVTLRTAFLNSSMRSRCAAATSTASPTAIEVNTRSPRAIVECPPIAASRMCSDPQAAAPIAIDATVISAKTRRFSCQPIPPTRPRSNHSSSAACTIAAIVVPSASPVNPIARTSSRLRAMFTATATALMTTGVRLSRRA